MSTYTLGTVADVTFTQSDRDEATQRAMLIQSPRHGTAWQFTNGGRLVASSSIIKSVKVLEVIDPAKKEKPQSSPYGVSSLFDVIDDLKKGSIWDTILDAAASLIDIKPEPIPQPANFGAVVETHSGKFYVRTTGGYWIDSNGHNHLWDSIKENVTRVVHSG